MTYTYSTRTISGITSGAIPAGAVDSAVVFTIASREYIGVIESAGLTSIVLKTSASLPGDDGTVDSLIMEGEIEADPAYTGYCSQDGSSDGDIAPARISIEQLRQLTGDSETIVFQPVVDGAIQSADDLINSYCGKHYNVPFVPIPSRVKNLSADIAVYNLFKKRSMETGGDVPVGYRKLYDDAVSFLKDVATGRALIDGAVKPPSSTANTGGYFHAKKKTRWD